MMLVLLSSVISLNIADFLASYPGLNEWPGYEAILFFFELISR